MLVKHVGCTSSPAMTEVLKLKAKEELRREVFRHQLSLFPPEEALKAKLISWRITGYHQVFGKVYDSIGFPPGVLKDLVVARIVHPKSKLSTMRYLQRFLGISLSVDKAYRFLDTLNKNQLVKTAFEFVKTKNTDVSLIFYDVTTLHFETDNQDELREKGYSKNHRSDVPQILIGLFVDQNGYPFDFDVFKGKTFDGHTFPRAIEKLLGKYDFPGLTVVADAGMLSEDNLAFLSGLGKNFIVGARLKNLADSLKEEIFCLDFKQTKIHQIRLKQNSREDCRLVINYSPDRAKRDKLNREKTIEKLKIRLAKKQKLIHKHKYLAVAAGGRPIGLDQAKIKADENYDGLKGYLTNLEEKQATLEEIVSRYHQLWKVEKAFRMSKTDLRERPIYHRLRKRIESHLLICFCSLLVMKETETILAKINLSLTAAIEALSEVGEGKINIGKTELPIEKELDQDAKLILNTFLGH